MRKLVMSAIFIAVLFLVSCGGSESTSSQTPVPAPSPPPTTVVDARASYSTNCAACHGSNREGVAGLGPALTPTSLAKLSDAEIRDTILKGRLNTAMAGFEGRLSSEEIDALVQLIKYTSP